MSPLNAVTTDELNAFAEKFEDNLPEELADEWFDMDETSRQIILAAAMYAARLGGR